MRTLAISAVLGIIVAVVLALGLVSILSPDDLSEDDTVLTVYGER
jgi:hypothetical protein